MAHFLDSDTFNVTLEIINIGVDEASIYNLSLLSKESYVL